MIRIIFVCHGNICRSPSAEYIMKDIASRNGRTDIETASAAVSSEEIGNPIYPPSARELDRHGIPHERGCARRITPSDCEKYDLIVCMDESNVRALTDRFGEEIRSKITLLSDYAGLSRIDDPWYTRDFARAYEEISRGCENLFISLSGPAV